MTMIRTNTMTQKIPENVIAIEKPIMEAQKFGKIMVEAPCIEIPTYLPNLYYRKYKLIEKLDGLRYGVPTMENPETNANQQIVRPLTAWDKVLQDVAIKVEVMKEVKKYKIAEKAYFSRKCQRKIKRTELKKQEIYCYHRCLSSKLAERVMNKFTEFMVKQEDNHRDEPHRHIIPTNPNDAFIQDDDMGFGMPFMSNPANDLLDDLFVNNNIEPMQEQAPIQETIQTYMKAVINENGIGEKVKIKRSQFLNTIKQSMRKRFKYKEKGTSLTQPKTGGAELLLNGLIKAEMAVEEDTGTRELPAELALNKNISSHSLNPDQKKRKRKQDQFTLNWSEEGFDEMKSMNEFVDRKASKVQNLNDLLSLYVIKDVKSQNYTKTFEKTIQRFKEFPKTLQDIDVPQPPVTTRIVDSCFSNQSQSNQQYNIEALIDHFIKISPYLFTEELDLSNKNYKMQIDPKYLFTVGSIKQKQSILFKFDKGQVQIIDQKFFSKQTTPFGKLIKHTELFFLIEYYLSKFGNQWGLITECIRVHPILRGMYLTSEQIESLHGYYNMKKKKNISFSDKVILPFKDEYEETDYISQTKTQATADINQDNYEAYIKRQMQTQQEETKQNQSSYLGAKFNSFIRKSQDLGFVMSSNTFVDSLKNNMSSYLSNLVSNMKVVKFKEQAIQAKPDKEGKPLIVFESKQKPKIAKSNISFRRRKIINEKTSHLVGVLSKKKPTMNYPQYPRNDFARKQDAPVPPINPSTGSAPSSMPVPPSAPAITTVPPAPKVQQPPPPPPPPKSTVPKQALTVVKEKTEEKQKTPAKKTAEEKKAAGAAGKEPNSRRRKQDPKPDA